MSDRDHIRALLDPCGDVYLHVGDLVDSIHETAAKAGDRGILPTSVDAIEMVASLVMDYGTLACRNVEP